ncbi:MAG: PadR family transcriptional regulator [bacterium]|nr:PadR family transcriptional regulator [bacterium]
MNEFLLLYVLAKKPANIYEIKKFIDSYFSPFMEISTGAIIPALNRLEKAGCVIGEKTLSDGGLKRSIYSLTDAGEKFINTYLEKEIEGAPQLTRRETEVLMTLLNDVYFNDEQKKLLQTKIKNALNDNIKRINCAIKYGKMNTEYLNMELIYSEAKLRMLTAAEVPE